uniref:Uncharacterized protein n=1 Tax=Arundo donax TaxID=35708 RepID=A0A0A9EBB6_ARUDO
MCFTFMCQTILIYFIIFVLIS